MTHSQAANRRLFALFLPYLLLAVAGGGLHHHGSSTAEGRALSGLWAALDGRSAVTIASSDSDSDCLACQWLLHSNACSSDPAPAQVPAPALSALAHKFDDVFITGSGSLCQGDRGGR